MAKLTTKLPWDLAQPKWASELNPILGLPILQGVAINGIVMSMNVAKVINHKLQRKPQGWFLIDQTEESIVWRTLPFNDLTLTLESNADTIISIWVF